MSSLSRPTAESSVPAVPYRRGSSSFMRLMAGVGLAHSRSQDEFPPPSPGSISASTIYSSLVHYRLPHLLVTHPRFSRVPVTEDPSPQCLIGYGPVLEVYSNLSTPPREVSVRVNDDNSNVFTGAAHTVFIDDLDSLHCILDERFEARLKCYHRLDTFLSEGGYRDKQAMLHQTLWQADFEDWIDSLPRPLGGSDDSEWHQYKSVRIAQMPHLDTFNTIKGNRILHGVRYEPPKKRADVIAALRTFMAEKTGIRYISERGEEGYNHKRGSGTSGRV